VTDGGSRRMPVDLTQLYVHKDTSLNVPLAPGDLVLISARDPEIAYVQVVGQVKTPGPYHVVPSGATVLDVLNQAGGATDKAALSRVQIMHAGETRFYNLRPLLFNSNGPIGRTRVVAGDVVSVPLNDDKIAVVGNVRKPDLDVIPDGEKWT